MLIEVTHLMNMHMPVGSIALAIPFHEAIMEYFCLAVSGRRGSGGGGAAPSRLERAFRPLPDAANLPSSQPMPSTASNFRNRRARPPRPVTLKALSYPLQRTNLPIKPLRLKSTRSLLTIHCFGIPLLTQNINLILYHRLKY